MRPKAPSCAALEPSVVFGNRDRIKQLALILLENAMKYSPDTGPVTLALRCADGWAQISVTDGGPGIAAEHLTRVSFTAPMLPARRAKTPAARGLVCRLPS